MDLHKLIYLPVASQPKWFRIPAKMASFIWLTIACVKNVLYKAGILRQKKLPGVTISVGNITVGGTGKSPVVLYLARLLKKRGYTVGILTRGYGSGLSHHDFICLLNGSVLYHQGRLPKNLPDEAMMQSLALSDIPVLASPDRYHSALLYEKQCGSMPQIWILDDGFQHRKLFRHIDLTLLDAQKPFGNGQLLPLGSLREAPINLNRSSGVLLTRSASLSVPESARKQLQKFTNAPLIPVKFIQGWPVGIHNQEVYAPVESRELWLVSGIAEPDRMLSALRDFGLTVDGTYFVQDHENFAKSGHESKLKALSEVNDFIITEKDFCRDQALFLSLPGRVFILPLSIALSELELLSIITPHLTP